MAAAGQAAVIMDDVWKSFPPELHENVLRFVPLPELCRLRAVSPAWNHLIKQLKFADTATYIFRTPNIVELHPGERKAEITRQLKHGWRIYDPSVRQSFPLDMCFLYQGLEGRFSPSDYCKTVAADRGFVASVWISPTGNYDEVMRVANPVTGSFVNLPPLCQQTRATYYDPAVLMVVEEDHSAFTLYIVQEWDVEPAQSRRAFRLDSRVREWQEFPQPSAMLNSSSIVKLGSTLFALFWDMKKGARYRPRLLAFDAVRGAWTDTAVKLPAGVAVPRLATALGRLFYVGFGGNGLQRGIQLLELDVASAKCTVVASLDDEEDDFAEEVYWLTISKARVGVRADVVAMGLGDHIVVSSATGAMAAYDLANAKWCAWAAGDGIENHMIRCRTYATTMSLTSVPCPGRPRRPGSAVESEGCPGWAGRRLASVKSLDPSP